MLYLYLNQALELLNAARNLKECLAVRYCQFNGLSPMEISNARREHLDPATCTLLLTRRHWKDNEPADIDPETVRLQLSYSGPLETGPLLRNRYGGHLTRQGVWDIVKRVALRTNIPDKEQICPRILKYTFASLFLKPEENTVKELQKAFSHKHLASTEHYLKCNLADVHRAKTRMMVKVEQKQTVAGG